MWWHSNSIYRYFFWVKRMCSARLDARNKNSCRFFFYTVSHSNLLEFCPALIVSPLLFSFFPIHEHTNKASLQFTDLISWHRSIKYHSNEILLWTIRFTFTRIPSQCIDIMSKTFAAIAIVIHAVYTGLRTVWCVRNSFTNKTLFNRKKEFATGALLAYTLLFSSCSHRLLV